MTLLLVKQLRIPPLPSYFLAINSVTLLAYGYDKRVANGTRTRVPEWTLHFLAIAGGTPGALFGQALFRHKTQKWSFRVWFWSIAVLQAIGIVIWAIVWRNA
jgi:uncharacterized membrane protein YsdA (DUF1294 family)